jgi:hypothetical protein
MNVVRIGLCVAASCWLLACGGDAEAPEPGAAAPVAAPVEIGGRYEVTGVTIGIEDGEQRAIHGTVNLRIEEGTYRAHVELATRFPGSEAVAARVVGTGEGTVEGNVLVGSAQTQLLTASVPGVDVGFAYVPRDVGPKIVSQARAEFHADGSVAIELENAPGPGEDYRPTRTHLVGYRTDG